MLKSYQRRDIPEKRQGIHLSSDPLRTRASLPPELLYRAYKYSAYIRPCVDGIVRTVTGRPWEILPVEPRGVLTATEQKLQKECRDLFLDPNNSEGTWRSFFNLVLTDLMIYDEPAIEIIRGDATRKIVGLLPLFGPSVTPIRDEHAITLAYEQTLGTKTVKFKPNEMIYCPMFATTLNPRGVSIIETCLDQITYLLLMADHHTRLLSRDEIPDGILFATGVAKDDLNKIINEAKSNQGKRDKFIALGTQHPNANLDWVAFSRASREEQRLEIAELAERIICRNFGIDPTTAGLPQKFGSEAKAKIEVASTDSTLIGPICDHLAEYFTIYVVNEMAPGFKFVFPKPQNIDTHDLQKRVRSGLCTVQEGRAKLGYQPYENAPFADRPFIEIGGKPFFLDTGFIEEEKVAPAPVKNARLKGHKKADKIHELISRYHMELQNLFDTFGVESKSIIVEGLIHGASPNLRRADRDRKVEGLKLLRDKYLALWSYTLDKYAIDAARVGTERALEKIGVSKLKDRAQIIAKFTTENKGYMKDAWRKYTDRLIWVVNRITDGMNKGPGGMDDDSEFSDIEALLLAAENALRASDQSIAAYAKYLWAIENIIYGREADAAGLQVYWHLNSNKPCPDCDSHGGMTWNVMELDKFPGHGTMCDGNCYCFLEILNDSDRNE